MADPTSTAASSLATGASALTVALIGVDHYILLAAFMGSGLGVTIAPKLGLWRTISVFAFMMFGACMVGPWVAELTWPDKPGAPRAITFIVAACLHAAFAAALNQIEPIAVAWAKKLGAYR